jgi:hypothetical protein
MINRLSRPGVVAVLCAVSAVSAVVLLVIRLLTGS